MLSTRIAYTPRKGFSGIKGSMLLNPLMNTCPIKPPTLALMPLVRRFSLYELKLNTMKRLFERTSHSMLGYHLTQKLSQWVWTGFFCLLSKFCKHYATKIETIYLHDIIWNSSLMEKNLSLYFLFCFQWMEPKSQSSK